jgi:uncharacterized membrane protein
MFIGHFAVGFAAKKYAPRTSLALLLAAPLLSDLLWPWFLLFGWERVRVDPGNTRFVPLDLEYFPWSHSLLMCVIWATAFALTYYLLARYWRGTVAIWLGVVSHWVLDWITHRPDMPIYPGGQRFGLGLWNSVVGTMALEIAMLIAGVWLYVRATKPLDRVGRYAFAVYVALLFVLYVADYFGSPPSGTSDIIWSGIPFEFVALVWAWWFDRHRFPLDSSKQ